MRMLKQCRFKDPEDSKRAVVGHFGTDACTATLEYMVADLPTRLHRPHVVARHILNVALACGFRAGSKELENLMGAFSQEALKKYWRVLWSPRSPDVPAPQQPACHDGLSWRALCDALFDTDDKRMYACADAQNHYEHDELCVFRMGQSMYSPSLMHYCGLPGMSIEPEVDAAVAVRLLSQYMHGHSADKLLKCISGALLQVPLVAEALLTRRDAYHTKNVMDAIGPLKTDKEFVRRVLKKNPRLLKWEGCDLKLDKHFVLGLMDSQSPDVCYHLLQHAGHTLRKDGTFISESIGKCLKIYNELKPHQRTNPLYALAYLVKGRVHLNWACDIVHSSALADSEDFARMMLHEEENILSHGIYHIYSFFTERIRAMPHIARLAFKACNGVKKQRDSMFYTMHLSLYGDCDLLAQLRVKDSAGWLREAVLERARPLSQQKSSRVRNLNVHRHSDTALWTAPPYYVHTDAELKWLEKHHPALLEETRALVRSEQDED